MIQQQKSLIRKMTVNDVPQISLLDQNVDPAPWSEKLYFDCVRVGYECWVIEANQQFAGFGITSYGGNEAHLLKLAIEPLFQRQGLGQKLLLHLISLAKVHGALEMFLEVRTSNTRAINLYQKNQFVEVGMRKGYYPASEAKGLPKEDAITMALPLL